MAARGRGCLELKPSNNPFLQTTSADIGCVPTNKTVWTGNPDPAMKLTASRLGNTDHEDEHFSFLYSRESDKIGSKVKQPVIPRNRLLTKTEFLKKRREDLRSQELTDNDNMLLILNGSPQKAVKKTAEEALLYYKQGTKVEDPRYTTSNNCYGLKAPTAATFTVNRLGKAQDFSNSFNNVKPQNTSLNTGLSKSTVHPRLDPQFA